MFAAVAWLALAAPALAQQSSSVVTGAPPTTGTAILKGNGSGGFSNAASGTDYAPATTGSAILKGNGSGGFSNAASGTDYAPATTGSAALAGNGSGGFSTAATSNLSDVVTPTAWPVAPADGSGQSIAFSSVTTLYTKIGKHVTAQMRLTYGSSSNGAAAIIGNLPATTSSSGAQVAIGICYTTAASPNAVLVPIASAGSTGFALNNTNAASTTDANLSTQVISCDLSFISN